MSAGSDERAERSPASLGQWHRRRQHRRGDGRILCLVTFVCALAGCAQLGLKSLPWPTSSLVHDAEAVRFLRETPALDGRLGAGLQTRDMHADGRLVGLSFSGGGARAAAFTLGVLTGIENLILADGTPALDRVDFVSSNSGGSWGIAAYLVDRSAIGEADYDLDRRVPEVLLPRFAAMSRGRIPCWSRAMQDRLLGSATYRQVYAGQLGARLPVMLLNAALLPSHSPFVFNDAFLEHYRVARLGSCGTLESPVNARIADVPIAHAAAASGSVPGFYHAYAETQLCEPGRPTGSATFCHGGPAHARSWLRLADGGLYDNIGYKTALEVMLANKDRPVRSRAMILVNSNTSTDLETIKPSQRRRSFLATTASNGIFAVQDSSFERLHRPMFQSAGVQKPVLLDFFSLAGFREDQKDMLVGLEELVHYAAYNVGCYDGDRFIRPARERTPESPDLEKSLAHLKSKGGDCLSENFYRTGTLNKTTYRADPTLFTILWQLGKLSVKLNQADLKAALD